VSPVTAASVLIANHIDTQKLPS